MKHEGVNADRCSRIPEEAVFAKAWREENTSAVRSRPLLEYLLKDKEFTDRDAMVAATVVQWLGSPVGLAFLGGVFTSHPNEFRYMVKMWHEGCGAGNGKS